MLWTDELHETYEDICSDLHSELKSMVDELQKEDRYLVLLNLRGNFRFLEAL